MALPLQHGGGQLGRAAQRHAIAFRIAGQAPALHVIDMVLQVAAHARQLQHRGDAVGCAMGARPYARQHQQLGRAEGAGRHDHFAPRMHLMHHIVADIGHALGHASFAYDARRHGVGNHLQVGTRQLGRQVALGGAAALTVAVRDLVHEGAILLGAVVVGRIGDALGGGGVDEHLVEWAGVARITDVERAAAAVPAVVAVAQFVVLGLLEVWQHVVVGPAGVAQRAPVVVVPAVAAHIQHGVDGTAAAQRLAARLVAAAAVQAGLGYGLVGVVVDPGRHHGHQAGRRVDQHAAVGAARLQQAHRHVGVFRQAGRQHAAGRTSADDDVVKILLVHACLQLRAASFFDARRQGGAQCRVGDFCCPMHHFDCYNACTA